MKFKVGDIVRFIENHSVYIVGNKSTNLRNIKGRVISVSSTQVIWIPSNIGLYSISSGPDQLELAKEQVVKSIINDILAN